MTTFFLSFPMKCTQTACNRVYLGRLGTLHNYVHERALAGTSKRVFSPHSRRGKGWAKEPYPQTLHVMPFGWV